MHNATNLSSVWITEAWWPCEAELASRRGKNCASAGIIADLSPVVVAVDAAGEEGMDLASCRCDVVWCAPELAYDQVLAVLDGPNAACCGCATGQNTPVPCSMCGVRERGAVARGE